MNEHIQPNTHGSAWPWPGPIAEKPGKSVGKIRRRAVIQSAVTVAIGSLLWLVFGKVWLGRVVVGLGVVLFLFGLLAPPVFVAIERGGKLLAKGVATGLTWVLLVPFFYVVFSFGRLCLILLRKDPLSRKFPGSAETYWDSRPPVRGPEHYGRQY